MTQTSISARQAGRTVAETARQKAASPAIQWLERFGFLARGAIYIVIGFLAVRLAAGAGGKTANPASAITLIGSQPLGKVFLIALAVGLAGYSLWGFVRAILDPLRRGHDLSGLLDRAGFLSSALSYGALAILAVLTLMNKPAGSVAGAGANSIPASLLAGPTGKWLAILFGLFWLVVGLGQIWMGFSEHFLRDLHTARMDRNEIRTATLLGKIGYAARGVVFLMIGVIILQTNLTAQTTTSPGYDAALNALAHGPYGQLVLAVVAVGLVLFGVYSALCSKWVRIGSGSRA